MKKKTVYRWEASGLKGSSSPSKPYACFCIGPENCKNKDCQLVKDYKKKQTTKL